MFNHKKLQTLKTKHTKSKTNTRENKINVHKTPKIITKISIDNHIKMQNNYFHKQKINNEYDRVFYIIMIILIVTKTAEKILKI